MKTNTEIYSLALPYLSSLQQVAGLKWGNLLGSPDAPDPVVVWEKVYESRMAVLVSVSRSRDSEEIVFGLSEKSCLLAQHHQEKQKGTTLEHQSVCTQLITFIYLCDECTYIYMYL